MRLRVFIAVTHLLGAGHLTRAAALARAFARGGHAVTLASGGMPAPLVGTAGFAFIQLPPVRIEGTEFGTLLDGNGRAVGPDYLAGRRAALLGAFEAARPDVLMTELFPFGRRVLADEFLALLEAARRRRPFPIVAASVRDILVAPEKPERIEEAHRRLRTDYVAVLVHGDPALAPLELSWPLDRRSLRLLHYTGYVDEDDGALDPPPQSPRTGIIVSGGSSAASLPLYRAAIEAARVVEDRPWRILVGAGLGEPAFAELRSGAPAHATVERARPDFRRLLAGAALSISQAGYNTVVDLLRTGTRAILVPFEGGRETEQRLRAERLAARGLARVLREAQLSGESLVEGVRTSLATVPSPASDISLAGAETAVRVMESLAHARPPSASSRLRLAWTPLAEALRRAADRDRAIAFWWRDDDAVAHTPALERLLGLADRTGAPLAIAIVPAQLEPALIQRLRGESRVEVLVHGLSHANHASPGAKRAEFGSDRALSALKADAELALETAVAAFGSRLLPVFVPPWNRIAPGLVPALPRLGYRGLSTFGDRAQPEPVAGLAQVNTHFDPIDWHGGRGLLDPEKLIAQLARAVADRIDGRSDADEPIGLLTHHLVHDEVTWSFCAELLERLSLHDNVRYPLASELFLLAESSNRDALQGLS